MRDSTKKIISNAQVRAALVSLRAVTKVNCRLGPGLVPKISCPQACRVVLAATVAE